jgi:ribosomal protein S6--L-glutamate ligase
VEAIIPRIGASITEHGVAVVRYFESHGVTTTATAEAIASSRDKLRSLQLMAEAGLPVPKTAVVAQTSGIIPAVHAVGGPPVVLKTNQGTQGQGVILAEDLYTAEIGYRRLQRQGQAVLVQAFLAEADGVDRRVIVVGDRCVAAMQRRAAEGEFRANLHRGGTAIGMTITAEMRALALKAARLHGLLVAGVDMIRSQNGLSLLEVNSSPGLEGIEEATEVDIAARIIRALEKARPRRAGKRSRRRR